MKNRNNSSKNELTKSNDFFIMDAELLPLVEEAENGCLYSQMVLTDAFSTGKKAKRDLDKKEYFLKKIYATAEQNIHKLSALWDLALIERYRGNDDLMREKFNIAIDFMQENMPMEEWDFELFYWIEKFVSDEE